MSGSRFEPTPEQRQAADPRHSVWLTASAGTGKTRVLADRVLRLLLGGARPDAIYAITFTKAAAAEMLGRIVADLGGWATAADDDTVVEDIRRLTGEVPDERTVHRARLLFARVLDLPAGLNIMTIHSLCQMILTRFPLEAGVMPGFTVIEDRERKLLHKEARDGVLAAVTNDPDLADTVSAIAAWSADISLDELLAKALASDRHLADPRTLVQALGVDGLSRDEIDQACFVLDPGHENALRHAATALLAGTKIHVKRGQTILDWLGSLADQRERTVGDYREALITKENTPLKALAQGPAKDNPSVQQPLFQEAERLIDLEHKRQALVLVERTDQLTTLVARVRERFRGLKHAKGFLDFDDLIGKCLGLLEQDGISGWVNYKLDGGIDHLLVDEAQDTSPTQWRIIKALTAEFFAGEGAVEYNRTLFVVGDEKQSIYGFQGASLESFRDHQAWFERMAREAGKPLRLLALDRSFRCAPLILSLVDDVFNRSPTGDGVVFGDGPLHHQAQRRDAGGLIEVWPVLPVKDGPKAQDGWQRALAPQQIDAPARRLAEITAGTIRGWLDRRELLPAQGRPIRPGDILVMTQKRAPFHAHFIRACKRQDLPVAGSDRVRMNRELAVADLVALGRFVLLAEDDLNLASLLKSPLVGLDEDQLFDLAHNRPDRPLFDVLRDRAEADPVLLKVVEKLERWRRRADFDPPFEFFTQILGAAGERPTLLARLGAEALEPIEAFLAQALAFERGHVRSLEAFLHWFEADDSELKRDPEPARDEIRVMTVHGAKGLEAPIVILPDTDRSKDQQEKAFLDLPGQGWISRPNKSFNLPLVRDAKEAEERRRQEEKRRLLYVALTRARDQLHVAAWPRERRRDGELGDGAWYELVRESASKLPGAEQRASQNTRLPGNWLRVHWPAAPVRSTPKAADAEVASTMPAWWDLPAPVEPRPSRPLSPSADEGENPPLPAMAARTEAIAFGRHVHRLLELVPQIAPEKRAAVVAHYATTMMPDADGTSIERLNQQIEAVLNHPDCRELFGPQSRAEQSVVGVIGEQAIAAQIDRIAVLPDRVIIADYKTSRRPPDCVDHVSTAYLRQMAAYKALIAKAFPDRIVDCLLIWTETGAVLSLDADVLGAYMPTSAIG
ncbi:MAG: double-strand break repair helicase AddA [Geminicoccaceae bacterium]